MKIRCMIFGGLAVALAGASTASAGPLDRWFGPHDCPKPSYSPLRYWAPRVPKTADRLCGPWQSICAPDRHPEIIPTCYCIPFHCPPADPASTHIPTPAAPPESKFRY
ncbi:MAG: hypothetical protein ACJ8F7_07925 [Gemmataceae bacterium]